jgi:hypothetical protein
MSAFGGKADITLGLVGSRDNFPSDAREIFRSRQFDALFVLDRLSRLARMVNASDLSAMYW